MRIVLHVVNGTGVGHLTRAGLLQRALAERVSGLETLACTNAAEPGLLQAALRGRAHVLRLPYTNVDEAAAGDDPTPREVNARAFFSAAAAFEPDLVLFDTHVPQALLRDRSLAAIPRALVLRTVTPAAAERLFGSGLGAAFDRIIVPADLGAPPLPVPAALQGRVRCVGPVVRPPPDPAAVERVAARFGLLPGTQVVVGTLGGGGPQLGPGKRSLVSDAEAFATALALAFVRLSRAHPAARFFLQLGLYGEAAALPALPQQVTVLRFDPDLPALLARADAAIALAGYNTVWELVQGRVPAVLLCKRSRHESQQARALAAQDLGAVAAVLTEPDVEALCASVSGLLHDPALRERLRGPRGQRVSGEPGTAQAAEALLELLHEREPPALQGPPPCAAPCQGCPVAERQALPLEEILRRGARRVLVQCSAGREDLRLLLADLRQRGLVPIVETTGRMAQQSPAPDASLPEGPALRLLLFGGAKKLHDRACGAPGSFAATLDLGRALPAGAPLPTWSLRTVRRGQGRQDRLRPIDRQVLLRAQKGHAAQDAGPVVALARRRWLPYSEVFVYNEALALQRHRPLALCKETEGPPWPAVPVLPLGDVPPDRAALLLERIGVRLIHGVFLTCALSFLGLSQALGVPLVVSARGHDVYRRRAPGPDLLPVFEQAALVLARTGLMAQDLIALGCPAHKIEVLPTGLPLERFPYRPPPLPCRDAPLEVIAVGRLVPKKGLGDVLRAFAVLATADPRARLSIYGLGHVDEDPQEVAAARALCDSPVLRGRARLLPAVPQEVLARALACSQVFLCGSRIAPDGDREGLPNALKEAMAIGVPVVSTAHGAIPQLLGADEPAGPCWALAPEGEPEALGLALLELTRQPETWAARALLARARIEDRFDLQRITARLESIYEAVVSSGAARSA